MLNELRRVDPEVYASVRDEVRRQHVELELIASENYVSQAVLETVGSVLTNKYAEGYPGARYYGGCESVDVGERLAIERAKSLFHAGHANVQPHSGSQANMAVYFALLKPGDTILSMSLSQGGHLSHGAQTSFSGKLYNVVQYGVNRETERIDMDEVKRLAEEHKPQLIIVGASAYSRTIEFAPFGEIARSVGARLMADIAHIAGLVAANLHPNPVEHCDVVTLTTHKTMRGPRGGIILCRKELANPIDSNVFPGIQGGPLMHVIAGKAVALKEALAPGFVQYQERIVANAAALAEGFKKRDYRIVSGGTDNHLMLVDLRSKKLTGQQATKLLGLASITVNKNAIPFDPPSPKKWNGIRVGSPALTTRGMGPEEMDLICEMIDRVLSDPENRDVRKRVSTQVMDLCDRFPIYSGILRRLYEQARSAYDVFSTG